MRIVFQHREQTPLPSHHPASGRGGRHRHAQRRRWAAAGAGWMLAVVLVCVAVGALSVSGVAPAVAASDCSPEPVVFDDAAGGLLTREEHIARMDKAFRESMARFETCQSSARDIDVIGLDPSDAANAATQSSNKSASAGAEAAGATTAESTDVATEAIDSVASSAMRGTAPPDAVSSTAASLPGATPGRASSATSPNAPPSTSDIPADVKALSTNDSKLEAQIRLAAMEETDPTQKAKLWNEYRKYKGLPPQPPLTEQGDPHAQDDSG